MERPPYPKLMMSSAIFLLRMAQRVNDCKFTYLLVFDWENQALPISTNKFLTFNAVFAEVSIKIISFSSAYCCASSVWTFLLPSMSALLPARAITTLGSPRL